MRWAGEVIPAISSDPHTAIITELNYVGPKSRELTESKSGEINGYSDKNTGQEGEEGEEGEEGDAVRSSHDRCPRNTTLLTPQNFL